MNKDNDPLSDALNIIKFPNSTDVSVHTKNEVSQLKNAPPEGYSSPHLDTDYEFSRNTLIDLVEKGKKVLDNATELAEASESPQVVVGISNLIKTLTDTTNSLYDLQSKRKSLISSGNNKKVDDSNITVEKAVFVGTTADLLKSLKDKDNTTIDNNKE